MSKGKPSPMRHITRMNYARSVGWWVRFYAGTKLQASKMFSDRKCGGVNKALKAAKAWRDIHEEQWASVEAGRPFYNRNSRNVTGVVGVALCINPRRKGLARFSWTALWSENNKQRKRRFSVSVYGYRRGFQLALDHRCDMLGLPRISKYPPPLARVLENRTY